MSSKTVFSPAKQPVEVITDDDWKQTLDVRNMQSLSTDSLGLVRALWHHGTFSNDQGFAASDLVEVASEFGYTQPEGAITSRLSSFLKRMGPAIERTIIGKRTYKISLVALPDRWYQQIISANGDHPQAEQVEQIPEPSEADRQAAKVMEAVIMPTEPELAAEPELEAALAEPELEPSPYLEFLPQVAMSLLTQVVEIISTGTTDTKRVKLLQESLDDVERKLAARLEENQKLRRELSLTGESLNATRKERDGLRQRLRMAEGNLNRVLKSDAAQAVDSMVRDELAKVMRATPAGQHGGDNIS